MKNLPTIIEICGVPYSRKTTTITKMAKLLRSNNIRYSIIDEFRGDGGFYESSKHTPDLNLVRAFKCINHIVTTIHNGSNCEVILIDRGIFDTYCWFKWFEKHRKANNPLLDLSDNLLDIIKNYSSKYYIGWMDIDPLMSIAHHSHSGSIVNASTVEELRTEYFNATEKYRLSLSISRVESENMNSSLIAERLLDQFKIIKKT